MAKYYTRNLKAMVAFLFLYIIKSLVMMYKKLINNTLPPLNYSLQLANLACYLPALLTTFQ